MNQLKRSQSALLLYKSSALALVSVAAFITSTEAHAACPNAGNNTATAPGFNNGGNGGGSGESLVTGSAYSFSGMKNDMAPNVNFMEGVNELVTTMVPDPANPTGGAVCPQYSHTFVKPSSGVTSYTVTISANNAATFNGLKVNRTDMNGNVLGTYTLTPAGTNSATFTLNVSATGSSDTFTYQSSAPGTVSYTAAGTEPSVTDSNGATLAGGSLSTNGSTTFRPRLSYQGPAISANAGGCIGPIVVTSVDGNGAAVDVSPGSNGVIKPMTVVLNVAPGLAYLDANCVFPTGQMIIQNPVVNPDSNGRPTQTTGTHSASFYMSATQAQALEIQASTNEGQSADTVATQIETILPNPPTFMRISGPGAFNQNECSAAFTLEFLDVYGNPAPLTANGSFSIAATGKAVLAQTSACNSGLGSTINLPAGSTNTTFYLVDANAESVTITVPDSYYGPSRSPLQGASFTLHSLGTTSSVATQDPAAAKTLALRLYDRLVSIPPSPTDPNIATMTSLIMQGRAMDAAHIATNQDGFYNITVRNLATTLSSRNYDPTTPLNDFVATWIGLVRDGKSATELLTGNYIYVGPGINAGSIANSTCADSTVYKDPSHYIALSNTYTNLRQTLVPAMQCAFGQDPTTNSDLSSGATPVKFSDNAGLLTTRQWAREHLYAGTNRRAIAFAFDVFLCHNIQTLRDNTMPDAHIRRDVDRAPGGDPTVFDSTCKSCHGGMDGLGGAFAFFDSYPVDTNDISETADFRMFYNKNAATVYPTTGEAWKMNKNPTVSPQGYVTSDDSWINYFTQNQNQALGWSATAPSSGNGANALGVMLSQSAAFPACMAQRVFASACKRPADPVADAANLSDLASDFQASGFNMRRLYEKAASLSACLGSGG